jgi:type IV secretory pathway VirB10-like protein
MSRESIIRQLENLKARVSAIQQPSALELDLVKDEIKALYQKVSEWEVENPSAETPQSDLHIVQEKREEEKQQDETSTPEEKAEIPEPPSEPEPPKEEPKPEPSFPKFVEKEPEEEKSERTIAERAEDSQEDNSLAAKLNKNRIANLKTAIGLNDKFAFVNGLFNGDISAYNEAIEKLDACENLNSAQEFVGFLQKNYEWDEENSDLNSLLEFVERRFGG